MPTFVLHIDVFVDGARCILFQMGFLPHATSSVDGMRKVVSILNPMEPALFFLPTAIVGFNISGGLNMLTADRKLPLLKGLKPVIESIKTEIPRKPVFVDGFRDGRRHIIKIVQTKHHARGQPNTRGDPRAGSGGQRGRSNERGNPYEISPE